MTAKDITEQLETIATASDFGFEPESSALTKAWIAVGVGEECIEPILRFMEDHPLIDYGVPGALVHFIERFSRKGYDEQLVRSVNRKPIAHTVWMLNRMINGAKDEEERKRLVHVMRGVKESPAADNQTRSRAMDYLKRLEAPG